MIELISVALLGEAFNSESELESRTSGANFSNDFFVEVQPGIIIAVMNER